VRRSAVQVETLYREVRAVLERARNSAYRAVNVAMVRAYWEVGRLIVEHEQGGRRRAGYGEALLEGLSGRLTSEFGRGFDVRNLRYMRQFYLAYPAVSSVGDSGPPEKRNALRSKSARTEIRNAPRSEFRVRARGDAPRELRPELSWTHYRLLLGVEDRIARDWYMNEAADQHWSTRQLDRQISVLYYERLVASDRKAAVRREAREKLAGMEPHRFIRDPYVLEFLDLRDYPALRESKIEQAIIDNLQSFLLELGKGFSFVARQKRLRFEEEQFYVDLVFYNYLLKCFVLIDLKVGALTHQDIGQMDSYVRMFDAHARPKGDNPTIGLILCSRKNEAIAKYSVLAEGRQIFAARYVKVLPTEVELRRELERERRLVESRSSAAGGRRE
jgi:predicted nuclease of restriction endonuclease-like (RecB) superfamily